MLLKGSTAVIVGGSGGLGLEIARTFSREGARVVIMDRNADVCEVGVSTLQKDGVSNVAAIIVDVSSPESVAQAFAALDGQIGKFDILINSAGVREVKNVFDLEPQRPILLLARSRQTFVKDRRRRNRYHCFGGCFDRHHSSTRLYREQTWHRGTDQESCKGSRSV
jgi:NAD(P)-dependent dehydrogenase (short-subunit alcohol dehydrogenase family)